MSSSSILAQAPAGTELTMTRTLDAPRELVWKAFTEAERLRQWFGPVGMVVARCSLDLRPGGAFHYLLETPDGFKMWAKWIFREVLPPERLVFVLHFSDESGGKSRHPGAEEWPEQMLVDYQFIDLGGRTKLVLRSVSIEASAEEHQVFKDGHDSMLEGYGGTFDRLAEYLKQVK